MAAKKPGASPGTSDESLSPVQRWRAAAPFLPPLTTPAAATAEALLLHIHYAINWDESTSWIAANRHVYWEKTLPGRVRTAASRARNLDDFWSIATQRLGLNITNRERRAEVGQLLRADDPRAVRTTIRRELPALIMRVQIITTAVGDARPATVERRQGKRQGKSGVA